MDKLSEAGKSTMLQARSFDLSAAYRQLCISVPSRKYAYISVYNPSTKCNEVFSQVSLPFGSRAAVNAFIRCARCIQWFANSCLLIPTTSYYDDFVVSTVVELGPSRGLHVRAFRTLGLGL